MSQDQNAQDPLEFVRGMWSNMGFSLPGMVTPTLDVGELDKRIADLRAVEGWLKMNLNMLQMTTQGLEMQRAALAAVQAMSDHARQSSSNSGEASATGSSGANPFAAAAAMWPWNFMGGQNGTPAPGTTEAEAAASAKSSTSRAKTTKKE